MSTKQQQQQQQQQQHQHQQRIHFESVSFYNIAKLIYIHINVLRLRFISGKIIANGIIDISKL